MKANSASTAETAAAPRFFRRLDWSAFWTSVAVSFAVYFYTMAPAVTLEDCGELATASANLGVPHPPGYPIWSIITWCFTKVFAFIRFRGQPNPAWSVALASVVCGALASGFTAILVCRSGTDMLRSLKRTTEVIGRQAEDIICWTAGVSASLIFAFSPVNWSQAVIVEAYSLNAFFLVLIMFLIYVWMRSPREPLPYVTGLVCLLGLTSLVVMIGLLVRNLMAYPGDLATGIHYVLGMLLGLLLLAAVLYAWKKHPEHRLLYLMAFVFGLGLTNYQILLLLMASLVLVILLKDLTLFRDFAIAGVPFVLAYLLIKKGILPFAHPSDAYCIIYLILSCGLLAVAYAFLPNGKAVAPAIVCLLLGLAVYGYMPLSSDTNPPINWGYPRTWEGFLHALFRQQYEKISPPPLFSKHVVHQFGFYLADLRGTFTLPIAIFGFLPFAAWSVTWEGRRFRVLYVAVAAALLAVALVAAEEVIAPTLKSIAWFSWPYRALAALIILLAVVGGIIMVVNEVRDFFLRLVRGPNGAGDAPRAEALVDMDVDADSQKWTLTIFVAFIVMSGVLVWLADLKGDIQDTFIQRVKFISSHALFSFWIGYGQVLGFALVLTLFRGNRLIKWAGVAVLLCVLPAVPILENAYNAELIRINGGAEQNGHDFGWQFGNYQLRGAQSITEELSAEEEPLPNPSFPPEMGPGAVFFGGTDPGRFVPTYMIYCADVRPDVYLITQNALADNTYMQVMRDLYGDRIYIPAQEDSAAAFKRYVDEVHAGKRPPNAELKIENGRVQVSGALGVMEINGILAQMIFERNNYKHEFFVEESYVIQWMYPYLQPHGLIMKINPQTITLSDEMVRNDMDFWDWYTRRLHGNRKFIRDVVARKSFSKLRSAIAGLYTRQGHPGEAEQAFQQARVLYPLSPEANFRLVQEVIMAQGRFSEGREIMQEFRRQDPGNDRVQGFVDYLQRLENLQNRVGELEQKRQKGAMDVVDALELAQCFLQLQRRNDFNLMVAGVLASSNLPGQFYYKAATLLHEAKEYTMLGRALDVCGATLPSNSPPEVFLNMARMYYDAKRVDKMAEFLLEYVKRRPEDWKAWLDLAFVQMTLGRTNLAAQSLLQARNAGGEEAEAAIGSDERFAPIRNRISAPRRNLLDLPGVVPAGGVPPQRP